MLRVGVRAYQIPPTRSRRSNTRIESNAFSSDKARTAARPEGPAPITATLRIGGI
jgi:hypothetical protein